MHLLSLQLHGIQLPTHLKFKTEKDAKREYDAIVKAIEPRDLKSAPTFLNIQDDYGHSIALWSSLIAFPQLVDFEADVVCQAEIQVSQARGQAQANRAMQSDPALKFAMGQGGGIMMPQ